MHAGSRRERLRRVRVDRARAHAACDDLSAQIAIVSPSLNMVARSLQCFFARAHPRRRDEPRLRPSCRPGETHQLTFRDVDGNDLSTRTDTSRSSPWSRGESEEKARQISQAGARHYIGDPKYRYVTLVNFQRGLAGRFRGSRARVIRGRLDAEAKA